MHAYVCVRQREREKQTDSETERGREKERQNYNKTQKECEGDKKRVLLIFCNVQVLRNNFIKICPLQERKLQVRTGGKSLGIRLYVSLVELEVVK